MKESSWGVILLNWNSSKWIYLTELWDKCDQSYFNMCPWNDRQGSLQTRICSNIFHQALMNCKLQPPSCSNIYLGKNIQCSVSVNQMLIGRSYRILVWHDDRSHKSVTGVQASLCVGMSRKLCGVARERRRRRVEKYGERVSWLAKGQISELEGFSLTIDCCPFSENKLLLCVLKFWLENGIIWIGTWTSLRRGERSIFLWSPSFGPITANTGLQHTHWHTEWCPTTSAGHTMHAHSSAKLDRLVHSVLIATWVTFNGGAGSRKCSRNLFWHKRKRRYQ